MSEPTMTTQPLHTTRFPGETDEYRRARDELLQAEVELRRNAEAVNAQRRELPLGGEVPADVESLLCLPGVGSYTARAVAAFAFGQRQPVVDTNVRRVVARAFTGQGEAGPPSTARDLAAKARPATLDAK